MPFGAVELIICVESTLHIFFWIAIIKDLYRYGYIKKKGYKKMASKLFYIFSSLSEQLRVWGKYNKMQRCEVLFVLAELRNTLLFFPWPKSYSSAPVNGSFHALLFVQTAFWVQNEHIKVQSSCMYAKLRKRHNDWKIFLIYGETEI